MVKTKKRAAGRKVAKTLKSKPNKRAKAPKPKAKAAKNVARTRAKGAQKKVATTAKQAVKKSAPKIKSAAGGKTSSAPPVKPGVASRPKVRDVNAGIQIAATVLERVTHPPRPAAAPLKMPFAVPLERPIAPLELRPAPLFERELISDDEE